MKNEEKAMQNKQQTPNDYCVLLVSEKRGEWWAIAAICRQMCETALNNEGESEKLYTPTSN